ncbi:cytochrome P450 [Nocardia macrotermitis]|uniref:Cytochrome P450 107B1 n=1 Tax=Nocardia macrotermitis TaxID=2585198 RepID=A0A7K0D2I5_9NOCA|nr:cytochrome P450 [Nocardia macrotermitis]MQY19943.1 Cytochrome P450 107B1 [Nocardia macrotermitis]
MTSPRSDLFAVPAAQGRPVPHPDSPVALDGPRISLGTPEFVADPHGAYREMRRRYGSMVPIELAPGVPATLVIGYHTALRILNDPDHFPADPRIWERTVPEDCPVRPIMQWYPNVLRSAGAAHERYRRAFTAAFDRVDLHELHATVEKIAVPLINEFCESGSADLVSQYAFPLAFEVLNRLVGCSAELGGRVATGMAALFDTVNAAWGMDHLSRALMEQVQLRRAQPADDVTSHLSHHPADLTDEEMLFNLIVFYGGGIEPQQNLISNTLLLMITDERFGGDILAGSLSTRDALDEVLFTDPPMANFSITYPRQPILIEDTWLPAHQPVVVSFAACNNDPEIAGGDRTGNRSHLAWGAGPHACPARSVAYLVVQDAIDQLLDALPEIRLAVDPSEIRWRPGPFHRALVDLPVTFPPSPRLR